MIRILLTILIFTAPNLVFGQERNCHCIDELDEVAKLIENAKSYKIQIKRKGRKSDFEKWKEKIKQEIINDPISDYFCTGYLQKYISFIRDRHNEVYFIPEEISACVPTYSKSIDTLQGGTDEISGIYHAGADKILVHKENDSTWYGITLQSNEKEWTKGKIRLRINKTAEGNLELFEYYLNGLLFYHKDIEISEGRIHSTFWNKQNLYYFNKNHEENFNYKSIHPAFDYIGIGTLRRTSGLMKEADHFYKKYLDRLHKENIIIDLRNNGGGSVNQIKPLWKALRKNKRIKNIYVLINFKTASSAELAVLKLKEDPRTIIAGENSRGMVEYGYGNKSFSTKTDCAEYQLVLSTRHDHKALGKYEYVGIKPDIELGNQANWVEQIIGLSP